MAFIQVIISLFITSGLLFSSINLITNLHDKYLVKQVLTDFQQAVKIARHQTMLSGKNDIKIVFEQNAYSIIDDAKIIKQYKLRVGRYFWHGFPINSNWIKFDQTGMTMNNGRYCCSINSVYACVYVNNAGRTYVSPR